MWNYICGGVLVIIAAILIYGAFFAKFDKPSDQPEDSLIDDLTHGIENDYDN